MFDEVLEAGIAYFLSGVGVIPPTPPARILKTIEGGGTYFPRYLNKTLLFNQLSRSNAPAPLSSFYSFPNDFDLCLTHDYYDYNRVNREELGCGRKLDCFCVDERSWVEVPKGGVTFNPAGAIPLPDPAGGLTVILSFRVPFSYDGIILGQYHGLTQGFNEGAGDIVWRIRVDGRYLKDCGEMLVTLGNPKQLSPIYGGLMVKSGNLVEYLVDAPNGGGSLPVPGMANVLAGLHGWFWPRKV